MAAATGSPAEPQHEPAPATSDGDEEAATAVTSPETGELLDRVATEINQAFQASLVQVMSDIGREYGVQHDGKFAWMEKGGASVALADDQLIGSESGGGHSDDMRRILRELQASQLHVRELQQVVQELHSEQRLANQRVALYSTLTSKLKRDLVDERLALIEAKNEIKELRRSRDDAGSGGDRSPCSPSLQESDNPWSSPNKPVTRPTATGSVASGASAGSNLMAFNFYPSSASREGAGQQEIEDDEPLSPSSSSQTLRNTYMGQFLPSALLDSPQGTPKHARPFPDDQFSEEKAPPPVSELRKDLQSFSLTRSLTAGHYSTSETVEQEPPGDRDDDREMILARSVSAPSKMSVSPLQLSVLSELFDTIPVEELESILRRFDGQESAAIDHILRTHPSLHPVQSDSSLGPMRSPMSRSPSGHGKMNMSSGSNAPPPGSASNWKTEICMYYMQGKCNKTRRTCSFAHGESDLVRISPPSVGAGISKHGPTYKTRLCQAYENGTCTNSRRDCPMAHGINDLRESSGSISSTTNQQNLTASTPRLQSYKTELCYYFLKGNCNYSKEECRFAHGPSDLRTVESNTAQMVAASSGFGGDYPSSTVPPPPVSMEKQLQLQHQYQQQYQHRQPPAMPYQPQPPHSVPQQPNFVPPHQHPMQQHMRASSGQFVYQQQQYDMGQQQLSPYNMPPPGQFRYLKGMEEKRPSSGGRPSRRHSGSSWSSFDASGLPPSEY